MQISNGAIKKTVTQSSIPVALKDDPEEQSGVSINFDTFDLSDFAITIGKTKVLTASDEEAKEKDEIKKYLAESTELFELGEKYEREVVARGHAYLYELLASIYDFSLKIEKHALSKNILKAIRKDLKDNHEITLQSNATSLQTIVRFVIRADKMAASRYAKVLQHCKDKDLTATQIPDYITNKGGIAKLQQSQSEGVAAKSANNNSKERTNILREFLKLQAEIATEAIAYEGPVNAFVDEKAKEKSSEKDEDAEGASFAVFITEYDGNDGYKIISAHDLGKAFEDALIRHVSKSYPEDNALLEQGLRNFKRKISNDESCSLGLRQQMKRDLEKAPKNKTIDVIEMEPTEK